MRFLFFRKIQFNLGSSQVFDFDKCLETLEPHNFIIFGNFLVDLSGQIFVFFILTVVAAESAIGLALIVVLYRSKQSINVDDIGKLKG